VAAGGARPRGWTDDGRGWRRCSASAWVCRMWLRRSVCSRHVALEFVESSQLHPEDRGALTAQRTRLGVLRAGPSIALERPTTGMLDGFGMDTIDSGRPAGRPELAAMAEAGFSQGDAECATSRATLAACRGGRGRGARQAACGPRASRCCATPRACSATCTATRWTSPNRCWRCA